MDERAEISVRVAAESDRPAAVDLCRQALGWGSDDPNEAFFAWKHAENPFGPSPMWLAHSDDRLVGVRVFLRWRFRQGEQRFAAVRAVDTATHPDWQGKGIFRTLTLGALPDLRELGTDFVFNTPNSQSRPGYLKMGWGQVGRVPVALAVRSVGSMRNVAGAKAAAEKWSQPCTAGVDPSEAFAATDDVEALLETTGLGHGIHTDRSVEYLRWRYRFAALHYRVLPLGDSLRAGALVFRVRRRGTALELTLSEVMAPPETRIGSAVRALLRETGADYAIRGAGSPTTANLVGLGRNGFLPAPRLGPILTWKPIVRTGVPAMSELDLALGDVELF